MLRALLTTFIFLLPTSCFEEFEVYRETREDAQRSIEAGWIPSYLPSSAREIRERHNIDTNEIWISFTFDPNETSWFQDSCEPATSLPGPYRFPRWWPESLSGHVKSDPTQLLFTCRRTIPIGGAPEPHTGVLATDPETGKAWYWEPLREAA